MELRIGVIGDFQPDNATHTCMQSSLDHSGKISGIKSSLVWLPTEEIARGQHDLSKFDGFWGATGSPYASIEGALSAIKFARENKIPFLGTCGGCQHAILEFARNVLNFRDAEHAEYNPYGSVLFLSKLVCSLAGQTMNVDIKPNTVASSLYGIPQAAEQYYCNFGLARKYESQLDDAGFLISGMDASESAQTNSTDSPARIFELREHPFFMSTLFVPQARSSQAHPHPVVTGFLNACHAFAEAKSVRAK